MIIREEFSEYKTENGIILRVKPVLLDIMMPAIEKLDIAVDLRDMSYVIAPSDFDTSSMELVEPEKVSENDVIEELKFYPIRSTTNIYETKNSIIILISKVTSIRLTNKKDKKNVPILRYSSEIKLNVINK